MNKFCLNREEALAEAAKLGGEIVQDEEDYYDATLHAELGLFGNTVSVAIRSICVRTETETHTIFYI